MSRGTLYMNADIPGRVVEFHDDDVVVVALPLFHIFGLSSILNTCVLLGGTMSLVPRFDAAAVIGVPDATMGEEVHAIVATKAGHLVTEAELIDFGKQRIAPYKYPRTVEFRDSLPKGATGKILKKELRPGPG